MHKVKMIETEINGQFKIKLPEHRHDRVEWTSVNGWERKRLSSMNEELNPGDVMYYVGNEEGDCSGLLSMWGVKTVLIEPNPLVWPNSKAIWEANELEMPLVTFVGFASNSTDLKDGQIYLNQFPPCADGEVISNHGFRELHTNVDNPTITIDDLVERTGIIPSAISIDVEGAEYFVIEGALNTIKKYQPKIWLSGHPEFLMLYYNKYLNDVRNLIKGAAEYREILLEYLHEVHLLYVPYNSEIKNHE